MNERKNNKLVVIISVVIATLCIIMFLISTIGTDIYRNYIKKHGSPDSAEFMLYSKNPNFRILGINKLELIGERAKEKLPLLFNMLNDDNEKVRRYAAAAIVTIGKYETSLPYLIDAMNNDDPLIRLKAITIINKNGYVNQQIDIEMTKALADMSSDVREEAFNYLFGNIDTALVAQSLAGLLNHDEKEIVIFAIRSIGSLWSSGIATLPELKKLADTSQDPDIVEASKAAIDNINSE